MITNIGDCSVFGLTKDFDGLLNRRFMDKLGIHPQVINYGDVGQMFFYTSYGDVAETDQVIALKLGFLRSPEKSSLTSSQILQDKLIGPGFVESDSIRGNALIVCLGKVEPEFSAYKTILGVPQLYYYINKSGIICSDRLRILVELLDNVEINEDIIPMHFLFRSIPGELTYYRDIRRVLPGQFFHWDGKRIITKQLQTLDFGSYAPEFQTKNDVFESLNLVTQDYVNQAKFHNGQVGNLLSGGVDSTLIQYLLNLQQPSTSTKSFSYAVQSDGFQHEIEYAREASSMLKTDHTFVEFGPADFPGLLTKTIDILGQPPILETEPSMLSIAEYTRANHVPCRYFMSGQGADTVFGLSSSLKLKGIHSVRRIPGITRLLKGLGKFTCPIESLSNMLTKGSDILLSESNPDAFLSPLNSIAIYGDIGILRRCFGDQVLINALNYRREFAANYLSTDHYLEKVHVVDLMTDTYELGVQRQQIFLAQGQEQLHPFFDDDLLRTAFLIHPDRRYIQGWRPKYLLKDLLAHKTGASVSKRPKGFSIFENDLLAWMKSGPLRSLVEEIKLPGFLSKRELDRQLDNPDYFLWILLNFDIFCQRCLT